MVISDLLNVINVKRLKIGDMMEKLMLITFVFAFGCAICCGIMMVASWFGIILDFMVIPFCICMVLANLCVGIGLSRNPKLG